MEGWKAKKKQFKKKTDFRKSWQQKEVTYRLMLLLSNLQFGTAYIKPYGIWLLCCCRREVWKSVVMESPGERIWPPGVQCRGRGGCGCFQVHLHPPPSVRQGTSWFSWTLFLGFESCFLSGSVWRFQALQFISQNKNPIITQSKFRGATESLPIAVSFSCRTQIISSSAVSQATLHAHFLT